MTKVLVLGAGGIVGQHMLLSEPSTVRAMYTRKTEHMPWFGVDLNTNELDHVLRTYNPDVIVNLAGENRVDVVEADPDEYKFINAIVPGMLAAWCYKYKKRMIQASTQGIFSGDNPPYSPHSRAHPLTQYGIQKAIAEDAVLAAKGTIVRLTFVLGVRPFQGIGRRNPLEDMLEKDHQLQVNDRFFSPLFASDAAEILWEEVTSPSGSAIIHAGNPIKCSRYSIAGDLKYHTHGAIEHTIKPVSHEFFEGIAPRPQNTTWAYGSKYKTRYEDGLLSAYFEWKRLNESN